MKDRIENGAKLINILLVIAILFNLGLICYFAYSFGGKFTGVGVLYLLIPLFNIFLFGGILSYLLNTSNLAINNAGRLDDMNLKIKELQDEIDKLKNNNEE